MLTEIYIEGLLVDEDLADQVWEVWNTGAITDEAAGLAWWLVALASSVEGGSGCGEGHLKTIPSRDACEDFFTLDGCESKFDSVRQEHTDTQACVEEVLAD